MTRSPPDTLYDDDFFAWTQEQAAALRATAAALGTEVDIAHVAEEIEDLGKRDLREVESYLSRFVEHLIKIDGLPASRDIPHWHVEALHFQKSALAAYARSMRRLLDVSAIWRRGRVQGELFLEKAGATSRQYDDCPFDLDELLAPDLNTDAALAKLSSGRQPAPL